MPQTFIILGAGVTALTTSLHLRSRYPNSTITLLAKYLPGDHSHTYASAWAGANWLSTATDNGRQESWDLVTYKKFQELSKDAEVTGVRSMGIKAVFDSEIKDAGVLSQGTGKVWYEGLGALRWLERQEVPEGARFGFEMGSFVVDVQVYLPWLQNEARRQNIQIHRGIFSSLSELISSHPSATAYFNCTGLGSLSLSDVKDTSLYPTRGQILLVENPKSSPLTKMYFRSPKRVHGDTTYVFPRGKNGGVVLGGCRIDNEWNGDVNMEFAEDIKRRCCALAQELGKPEDLKVIWHGVGLRPSRKGGPRVEREMFGDDLVIHSYGAGGTGYQASWGMAKEAVDLLQKDSRL